MSGFRGRAGPNLSNYLSDLNTVSPNDNLIVDENDFSNDLAMFTNTDFTNIDIPTLGQDDSFNFDLSPNMPAEDNIKYEELLAGPSSSTDFSNFDSINASSSHRPFYDFNTSAPLPTSNFTDGQHDVSRASTVQTDNLPTEERSRLAAEEDKRRRNTAASARFRVKKKQREQALEKTLKEVQDKNTRLEAKVSQLEMENGWLKALITEKNGLQSKEEMAAAYEQHRKESEERDFKYEPGHTKGVGTDLSHN